MPVVILSSVLASISGLIRIPILVTRPLLREYSFMKAISSKFSTLIDLICCVIAYFKSNSVLPGPSKIIFMGSNPALRDLNSSPADTTSAPKLCLLTKLRIAKFGLAFTAKWNLKSNLKSNEFRKDILFLIISSS